MTKITDAMVKRGALAWVRGRDDDTSKAKAAARFHAPVRRMLEAALNQSQPANHDDEQESA